MSRDLFRVHHGLEVYTTLWRQRPRTRFVWRDGPAGSPYEIEFDDERGRPVDAFGLPLDGEFIDAVDKKD